VTSSLPVYKNSIKNILFRAATLLIQLAIYKLFSFLAFKSNAYTSFLMFKEDHVQKFLFVLSRGLTRHGLLVLVFAVFFAFANFYDTLLWVLDSPGYVTRSTLVTASSVTNQLLDNPAYVVFIADPTENVASLDVDQAFAGNLFVQGFNFTLPKPVQPGARDIVPTNRTLASAGPRIWLDDAGFSVGVDQLITVTDPTTNPCIVRTMNANIQTWLCKVNNTDALELFGRQAGRPQIWWDNSTQWQMNHYLTPDRRDNPWVTLGTNGDTTAMKQVFTVTKENRRHTFLQTVVKITMLTKPPTPLGDTEITDIIRRTFSKDSRQPLTPETKEIADVVIHAQTEQTSLTYGYFEQEDYYSIGSGRIELLNAVASNGTNIVILYTELRIIFTNITLIRSETLSNPVMPYGPSCPNFFSNLASGGKVRSNDCYKSLGNQTNGHFLGQLDTSAVFILTDVLGDGTKSTSAAALNQTGLDWYMHNSPQIENLLIARGLILGGDRTAVPLALQTPEAAISYLQLLLIVLSAVLAITMMVVMRESTGYYKNSFLAAVYAAMHIGSRDGEMTCQCTDAGYLHMPPEIKLATVHQHMVMGTSGGVFTNVIEGDGNVGSDKESK